MIPKFYEIFSPMLEFLKDGKVHSMKEVEEHLANYFGLTEEERNEHLSSGRRSIFKNRVGWVRTSLSQAKLVDIPQRGNVVITERGLEMLKKKPTGLNVKDLMQFPEFVEFQKAFRKGHKKERVENEETEQIDLSPDEVISEKIEEINNLLKSELLNRILKASPQFFERTVLDLIVKMGYGGSFEEASQLLGKSGDEGIDGLIKEDVLGLDNVYLQAKRWDKGTIGRPEIQKFVGALHGKGAKKGIFITTSTYSKDAVDYAEGIKDMKIILIDKDKLLDYMVKYGIGVEVKETIEIKKIDEDYFEEY